jgi:hypothetical protein
VLETSFDLSAILWLMTILADGLACNVALINRALVAALNADLTLRIVPIENVVLRSESLLEVELSGADLLRS